MGSLSSSAYSNNSISSLTPGRQPEVIVISKREFLCKTTSLKTIQKALEAFHRDGIVILQDAISHESLDHLHSQMTRDAEVLASSANPHFNHDKAARNLSQQLPLTREYLHENIWANPHASAVLECILGPRPQLAFAGANTALPNGTGRQAVHSDAYFRHLDFTFGVEVNIFLTDASSENGATEVWPGTHVGYNHDHQVPGTRGWIKKEILEQRARRFGPPVQPFVPKGGLLLRDLRMWHAGMPNRTLCPRIMLGFVYFPVWYQTPMRLTFPRKAKRALRSWKKIDAISVAEFVEGDVEHLSLPFRMNLTQQEDGGIGRSPRKKRRIAAKPSVSEENYWVPPENTL
ncbi:phytanoyl-dioxygenase family protein [Phlyctema vagabunda]|uniref:Phytanoyl-dioxygenase family protein n=1 Tax=Phlyctema vagabunda TaxID=108571 RepID=A0ABR4P211_9HELO